MNSVFYGTRIELQTRYEEDQKNADLCENRLRQRLS